MRDTTYKYMTYNDNKKFYVSSTIATCTFITIHEYFTFFKCEC